MLDKFKENKGIIIGSAGAAVVGLVLSGIAGSLLGETVGYSALVLYAYGLLGHRKVADFLESKVK